MMIVPTYVNAIRSATQKKNVVIVPYFKTLEKGNAVLSNAIANYLVL